MQPPEIQAASVRRTAIAFGIPVSHLRQAIAASELHTFSSGGSRSILIWDDVKAWLRDYPTNPRRKRSKP